MTETKRKAGRPHTGLMLSRVNLSLDDLTVDKARTLGKGNVSRGVRDAIEFAWEWAEKARAVKS